MPSNDVFSQILDKSFKIVDEINRRQGSSIDSTINEIQKLLKDKNNSLKTKTMPPRKYSAATNNTQMQSNAKRYNKDELDYGSQQIAIQRKRNVKIYFYMFLLALSLVALIIFGVQNT